MRSDSPTLLAVSVNAVDLGRDFGQGSALAGCVEEISRSGHGAGLIAPPQHNIMFLLGTDGLGAQTDAGTRGCAVLTGNSTLAIVLWCQAGQCPVPQCHGQL